MQVDIRDAVSIPELRRCPGEGHGNLLQCSHLENPMDRGAWQAMVHRVTESDTTEVIQHSNTHTSSKALSPSIVTLVAKASMYEFWRDTVSPLYNPMEKF